MNSGSRAIIFSLSKHIWLDLVLASTRGAIKFSCFFLGWWLLLLSSQEVLPGLMAEERMFAGLVPSSGGPGFLFVWLYWFTQGGDFTENSAAHHSTTTVHAITNAATEILIKLQPDSKGCAELLTEGLPCWEKNYKHNRISTVII